MYKPVTTYRIQFNKDFTFRDLDAALPYLIKLGIGSIYASPIFVATAGSAHGYDGTDPNRINPEIGTEQELRTISNKLKAAEIGWIQDIVPNHMAWHADNPWLYDYLEKGSRSEFRTFFDNSELSDLFKGPMMAPFLGKEMVEVVADGDLKLVLALSGIELQYFERRFPVNPESYTTILRQAGNSEKWTDVINKIGQITTEKDDILFCQNWKKFKQRMVSSDLHSEWVEILKNFAKDKHALEALVRQQHYELCHWKESNHRINYRRFFTINDLICLNIHRDEVFAPFHQLIGQLCHDGIFNGLRIDHIDGLYNPEKYLNDLRNLVGNEQYIIVEKILEPGEDLLQRWPVQGNTGYDFLSLVNNLFTNTDGRVRFTRFYRKFTGEKTAVQDEILENKLFILENQMAGESENLFFMFKKLDLLQGKNLPPSEEKKLKKAIDYFLVHCPVYRFYGNQFPLPLAESEAVEGVLDDVELYEPQLASSVKLLKEILLEKPLDADEDFILRVTRFYKRCMQFSGPLMAKGVEDTSMYTYNRFAGHNEVGDSPRNFGIHISDFHAAMKQRQQHWPLSLNATSTHDTKRGEDVRARLNVLTDLDKEWIKKSLEWRELNAELKSNNTPDHNDEYLIYQTIIGAHPFPGNEEDFETRIRTYLQKALREAKTHSNWTAPDEVYEQSAGDFAVKLLDGHSPFWSSFAAFHQQILDFGIINSLSQLLLKFTCPGVPDIYQGTELWNLGLVDPDNRRKVNYDKKMTYLSRLENLTKRSSEDVWEALWQHRYDGAVKMQLTNLLAIQRKRHADVFERGNYLPIQVHGKYSEHVCAFARQYQHYWYISVVPVNVAQLCKMPPCDFHSLNWEDTRLILPNHLSPLARNVLMDEALEHNGTVKIQQLFSVLPVAFLKFRTENERSSGILMHITSLPSAFGVGDLGPEAARFADFLHKARQRQWQILPLNPTVAKSDYSPYASVSSRAGNTMLISPEMLVDEGLLNEKEIAPYRLSPGSVADFGHAESIREILLQKAWERFQQQEFTAMQQRFERFCESESSWLDDFALFVTIQEQYPGKPWWKWPEPIKDRHLKALKDVQKREEQTIEKLKWYQFLFFDQWKKLRKYCRKKGIALMGDIPIYVSHHSADVWAHPYIFKLKPDGQMKGIAGVPPDYFSETGQLWGMPVFDWEVLKRTNFDWWIDRLRINLRLFDSLRIDHFRAFHDFWEVPAGEKTAVNGKWHSGPGIHFFEKVREKLGDVPFVAEDLGEISAAVFKLRDDLRLPGMKVLQFAFGEDMPQSEYIPHNFTKQFVAYTGTHDNNTVRGWYAEEGYQFVAQMERYFNHKITENNVAHAFCLLAHSSVAKTVILPLQDLLELDGSARMNTPGSEMNNWRWRVIPGQISADHRKLLLRWTVDFNRD